MDAGRRLWRVGPPLPELMEQLGVRVEAWRPGRVVLAPIEAQIGSNGLRMLSEAGMAIGCASTMAEDCLARDIEARVAFIALRTQWTGCLRAIANAASCPGRGWLLDVEVRAGDGCLISTAFAYARPLAR